MLHFSSTEVTEISAARRTVSVHFYIFCFFFLIIPSLNNFNEKSKKKGTKNILFKHKSRKTQLKLINF